MKKKINKRKVHKVLNSAAVRDGLHIAITDHTNNINIIRGGNCFLISLPNAKKRG